jgi:hypothetical protein
MVTKILTVASVSVVLIGPSAAPGVIVDFYNEDGSENLVNEIGKYSGESVIGSGPGFLQVHADGKWTVKVD